MDAAEKDSLPYFKPSHMSVLRPHPLWTTSNASSCEVNKSVVVARLLGGRYNSDWHARHWTPTNKEGFCLLCPGLDTPGTVEHLLVTCQSLNSKGIALFNFWDQQAEESPNIAELLKLMRGSKTKDRLHLQGEPGCFCLEC